MPRHPGPQEVEKEVILILFGVCVWDHLTSLWFEYRLITRKIRFRWQFVPYFLARYFVLTLVFVSAAGTLINFDMAPPCLHADLSRAVLFLGLVSLTFSTWNLLTRTAIIWAYHPLLMKLLYATGFVHFVLAFVAAALGRRPCTEGPPSLFTVMIFGPATALIEFMVLSLSLIGIRRSCAHGETRLARILMTQGIAYFIIVLILQISIIVVSLARTDPATHMWVGVAGAILSPILSCRLVISTISQGTHTIADASN